MWSTRPKINGEPQGHVGCGEGGGKWILTSKFNSVLREPHGSLGCDHMSLTCLEVYQQLYKLCYWAIYYNIIYISHSLGAAAHEASNKWKIRETKMLCVNTRSNIEFSETNISKLSTEETTRAHHSARFIILLACPVCVRYRHMLTAKLAF